MKNQIETALRNMGFQWEVLNLRVSFCSGVSDEFYPFYPCEIKFSVLIYFIDYAQNQTRFSLW